MRYAQLTSFLLGLGFVAGCAADPTVMEPDQSADPAFAQGGKPPGPPPGPAPQSGTVSGRKYHDLDADGTDDGGTDLGLGGWTILAYADDDNDGILDLSEITAGAVDADITDGVGAYAIDLAPGGYLVCEKLQAGWGQSAPGNSICAALDGLGPSGYAVKVKGGSSSTTGIDFGNYRQGLVKGSKFNDLDGDGTNNSGADPVLGGWIIHLYADADGDGYLDQNEFTPGAAAKAVTDAGGSYGILIKPGKYIVCEVLQSGWRQTAPADPVWRCFEGGPALGLSGYAVEVTSGGFYTQNDFGNSLGPGPLPPPGVP